MRTTIDGAGRIVIPKAIRDAAGLTAGAEVEVGERDGQVVVEAVVGAVSLRERDGFLAAERDTSDGPPLTVDEVRAVVERDRR